VAEKRPRNASKTRADILAAARARFGAEGYERTTLRAVAADVGVDPALVIRYFGSKQELFAATVEFTIELPDLSDVDPDDVAGLLLPRFFTVWEEDAKFVALLRAAPVITQLLVGPAPDTPTPRRGPARKPNQ
jgi:AcrR family transcriptional regulator